MSRSSPFPAVFASLAVLVGGLAILWALSVRSNGPLQRELEKLAGPDAVDCGSVRLGADRTAAAACAGEALRSGKAFRVAFEVRGVDSRLLVGLARRAGGTVMRVRYDSDRWGGSTLIPSPTTEVEACSQPVVSASEKEPIRCE